MQYAPPPPSPLHSTFHPPKKPAVSSSPRDEQECAVTVLYSGEPLAYSLQEQHYTCKKEKKKKAKPVSSKLTGRHNRMINHLRIYYLPVAYRCVWKMVQIVSISY